MRALIVDDSSFIREYLRALLQKMGVACEEAVNGSEALTVLAVGVLGWPMLPVVVALAPVSIALAWVQARRPPPVP